MIIIGDVHGAYKTLLALIAKLPSNEKICFVGDLIDRGPDSRSVVELVMKSGYDCVMANHEHMMLASLGLVEHNLYPSVWYWNGASSTLDSYSNKEVSQEHLDWIKSLPKYLQYPDVVNDRGQSLFVSHAAVRPYGPLTNYDLEKVLDTTVPYPAIDNTILWYRGTPARLENAFHVFGHTPTPNPIITDYYANIDTGAVYKNRSAKLGKLTALRFPQMEIYQQEYIG